MNIFNKSDLQVFINRVEELTPESKPIWGKMNAAQMLAHNNVAFEMAYDNIHKEPGFATKLLLKLFVKNAVVGPKPYPKNGRTAPQFIIEGNKDFNAEKKRLLDYLSKTNTLGAEHFEQRESHSFGKLTANEWNTMFCKHLDHHLKQFGV